MALEEGIVTRANGETAFITTRRTTACEGCSERHVCHSTGNVKEIEIEVANPLGQNRATRYWWHSKPASS